MVQRRFPTANRCHLTRQPRETPDSGDIGERQRASWQQECMQVGSNRENHYLLRPVNAPGPAPRGRLHRRPAERASANRWPKRRQPCFMHTATSPYSWQESESTYGHSPGSVSLGGAAPTPTLGLMTGVGQRALLLITPRTETRSISGRRRLPGAGSDQALATPSTTSV